MKLVDKEEDFDFEELDDEEKEDWVDEDFNDSYDDEKDS